MIGLFSKIEMIQNNSNEKIMLDEGHTGIILISSYVFINVKGSTQSDT